MFMYKILCVHNNWIHRQVSENIQMFDCVNNKLHRCCCKKRVYNIIIPHINSACKTSIGWRAIIRLSLCDQLDYPMPTADASTVSLHKETLATNGRYMYEP